MAMNKERLAKYKKMYAEKIEKKGDQRYLQIKEGDTKIRILPSIKKDGEFFLEFYTHYIDGQGYFTCPNRTESLSGKCPICDVVSDLYATGADSDKALAGKIRARQSFVYNAIDRDDEKGEVKILKTGIKLFDKFLSAMADEEIGDITDIKEGYDIIIRKKKVSDFWNYDSSDISRKSSFLVEKDGKLDKEKALSMLKQSHDLQSLLTVKTFEELQDAVGGTSDKVEATVEEAKAEVTAEKETPAADKPEPKEEPKSEPKVEIKDDTSDDDFDKDLEDLLN